MRKIILDLCGGTGSWSLSYKEAGFEVHNITLPDFDINATGMMQGGFLFRDGRGSDKLWVDPKEVFGVLSAPPCTYFSFARTNAKKPRDLNGAMQTVISCLKVIWHCQYCIDSDQQKYSPLKFWALENPYFGMLRWYLGEPALVFDPYDFGDMYKKKTALWGHFNRTGLIQKMSPCKLSEEMLKKFKTNSQELPKFDYMKSGDIAPEWFGKLSRQDRRAITPKGFAKAFFEANH